MFNGKWALTVMPHLLNHGMSKTTHYSIAEITVTSGKTDQISFILDDRKIKITIPCEVKAYFDAQFSRQNPTPAQRKKYSTLMNLMRAAYLQGKKDASA